MNRALSTSISLAMLASCATPYDGPQIEQGREWSATTSGAGGHSSSATVGSVGGGHGGVASTTTSRAVASSSATSTSTSTSSSAGGSGGGDVDCAAAPLHTQCDGGLCALDGVCRPLARCAVRVINTDQLVECMDPRVQHIRIRHRGPPFNVSYAGCRVDPRGDRYELIACIPGDECIVHMLISGFGDYDAEGRCE